MPDRVSARGVAYDAGVTHQPMARRVAQPSRALSAVEGIGWALVVTLVVFRVCWRLGAAPWQHDEPVYRNAAHAYLDYGNFSHNLEHPLLGKYLIGVSQSLFGSAAWATRLPAAVATVIAGLFLAMLASRLLDRRAAGFATFAVWGLLPHPDAVFDATRLAYLDPIMVAFVAAALWAGWEWYRTEGWSWAVGAGVLAGLAIATKLPAAYLLVSFLVLAIGGERRRYVQCTAVMGIAAAVWFLTWLPLGFEATKAWHFMAAMQLRHSGPGVGRAGTPEGVPRWLLQIRWQWDASRALTIATVVAVIVCALRMPRRPFAYVGASLCVPLAFFAVASRHPLRHWAMDWAPAGAILLGCGIVLLLDAPDRLGRPSRTRHVPRASSVVIPAVGVVIVAVVAAQAVRALERVVTLDRAPLQRVSGDFRAADEPRSSVAGYGVRHLDRYFTLATVEGIDSEYSPADVDVHPWIVDHYGSAFRRPPARRTLRLVIVNTAKVPQFDARHPPPALRRGASGFRAAQVGRYLVWTRARTRDGS